MIALVKKVALGVEVMYELVRARVRTHTAVQSALSSSRVCNNAQDRISAKQQKLVVNVARLVWVLGKRIPLGFTCLHRSIAAFRMLQRRAVECRMIIAPTGGGTELPFSAHAWVEIAGGQRVGGRISEVPAFEPVV